MTQRLSFSRGQRRYAVAAGPLEVVSELESRLNSTMRLLLRAYVRCGRRSGCAIGKKVTFLCTRRKHR